jgi:1,4-alpha-glucan branching enzyme
VKDLNAFYRSEPALFETDSEAAGFEWIDCNDNQKSVVSFLRRTGDGSRCAVFVCNFTPVQHLNFRVGVPSGGWWGERLNGDSGYYGGSGQGNHGGVEAAPTPMHGRPYSLNITVPPLCVVAFVRGGHG